MVAAECLPFARAGGLADAVSGLARELAARGLDVAVILPWYTRPDVRREGVRVVGRYRFTFEGSEETITIGRSDAMAPVPVFFLRHSLLGAMYGGDDFTRGGPAAWFFTAAVAELLAQGERWRCDAVHAHDWPTGLLPTLLRARLGAAAPRTIFTLHGIFLGAFAAPSLEPFSKKHWMDRGGPLPRFGSARSRFIQFARRGAAAADVVTTVSERFASDLLSTHTGTMDMGAMIGDVLRRQRTRFFGITNGIDIERYDPASDAVLEAPFDHHQIDRRATNKRALQRALGLREDTRAFVCAFVGRLHPQKGLHVLLPAIGSLVRYLGAQIVIVGDGPSFMVDAVRAAVAAHPKEACCASFDAALESRCLGGADVLLMPSAIEPCGLTQLKAMRYGCVPVVRATGGLADTVAPHDPVQHRGTGFVFEPFELGALIMSVAEARAAFQRPREWGRLVVRCMRRDVSWQCPAEQYEMLYADRLDALRSAQGHAGF